MIETTTEGPLAGERACEIGEWFNQKFQESNHGCYRTSGSIRIESGGSDAK